ncbi:MAG: hypothetical protein JWQ81_4743, partial [Amycolatopsis sp.]|nr:hypothetical protein [Amycolatopsis sp.]
MSDQVACPVALIVSNVYFNS